MLKEAARTLRSNMTDTEQTLWFHIRKKKVHGVQFYRQKILGSFIVDFYAPQIRLVIEIDGCQHDEPNHKTNDLFRDQYLKNANILVLRITNREIRTQLDHILDKIDQIVMDILLFKIPSAIRPVPFDTKGD